MLHMKIVTEDSLPRCFKNHPEASGLVYEDDIGIGSKLKLKLLVFLETSPETFGGKGLANRALAKSALALFGRIARNLVISLRKAKLLP